jgi:lysophospholipase L1-like esterase
MVILSFVLAFIVGEIGLRAYVGIINDSADDKSTHKAFRTYAGSGRVYGYHTSNERLETNSWGFRDREFDTTKDTGEKRIVMLGDSITAAMEVHRNETIPRFLEVGLRQATGNNYTVYNLGVTGYNVSQSQATLNEVGLKLSPDIVVYNLCLNDSDPIHRLTQSGLFVAAEISAFTDINLRTIVGSSYVLTFIKVQVINLLRKTNPNLINMLNNPELSINKRVSERAWSTMKTKIQEIRDVVVKNDAHFLVAIYPYASQVGRPASELLPQRDLVLFLELSDISFIDLIDVYASAERNMFIDSEVHLNAYGTERVAQALVERVISLDSEK